MLELWQAATTTVSLPFTLFLGIVLLYWSGVIIGALDMDALDVHVDAHPDLDIHGDVDVHGDMDAELDLHAEPGHLADILTFFNIGAIPFMVVVSIFALVLWSLAMALRLNWQAPSNWMAYLAYVPILGAGALLTKAFTAPLVKVFSLVSGKAISNVQGQICTLLSDADENHLSQGRVTTDGAPFLVNVKTREGKTLPKGSKALIIEKDPTTGVYYVEQFDAWED